MPVVGYLGPGSAVSDAFRVTAFRQGLSEAGFVEGQNVTVDYRWAEEHYDRLPDVTVAMVAPLGPHSSASTRACFEFARPRGLTAASRLRTDLGCRPICAESPAKTEQWWCWLCRRRIIFGPTCARGRGMLAAGPELRITGAAAQTRMVSVARIRLVSRKSTRLFKGIICDDISEFESHMPSHAVGSL